MNPYLEQDDAWQDFHDSFVPAMRDALIPAVSPDFIVKIQEHLYIHEPASHERWIMGRGDVSVARHPEGSAAIEPAGTTLTSPSRVVVPVLEETETYLEILDRHNRELITVIELLSPTNKRRGPDRAQYLNKRAQLIRKVNLVEIDLLRGGPRLPMNDPPPCDYYVLISQAEDRPEAHFWPIKLRDPLPVIPIPIREPRPIAMLDLQNVLHTVYDRAGYKNYIYDGAPTPPLDETDAEWAAAILKGA